jgi:hypothetical protein
MRKTHRVCAQALGTLLICARAAAGGGGYLSFLPPPSVPAEFDQVDFHFRMIDNPGRNANAYYAQNFNIRFSDGSPTVGGYMGLQSTSYATGKDSYALATIWPLPGQVLSLSPGPNARCTEAPTSAEGHIATCTITAAHPLADAMRNGDTFRLYVKVVSADAAGKVFRFGIVNRSNNAEYVLGDMKLRNAVGINSFGLSHFLEYFGANSASCATIPYTAYTEYAPQGFKSGSAYRYRVTTNPDGPFGPCQKNIAFSQDGSAATVEFAIKTADPL